MASSSRHFFVTGIYMLIAECPVRAMVDVIDGKWKPIIINALKGGHRSFGDLHREVPEASKKVLVAQLRQLEGDGVIARRSSGVSWERVEYSVTAYGKTLVPILTAMANWGIKHRRRGLRRMASLRSA
jgi:DNA-binding HxlR family transcriptional regulator